MKITKIIQLADMIAPNKLPTEIKVHYLNEVEGVVATEVLMLSTADVPVYTADDIDIEMLVKPPHDKLYLDYLISMIHFANGEYNKYANTFEKYNESLKEYHRFVFNTICPANGGAVRELYYVSAYAIAVAHGYKGSEDEFGEMLASGGGGGGSGEDGVSPVITVTKSGKVTTITIEDVEGVKVATINDGTDGKDGRGIASIDRTSGNGAAGTTDIYTIRYTDNTTSTFTVYNGANGSGGGGSGGGENGATFTPYVDASGNLTWTNDKGLPNPATVNIKGSKGENGISATHSWSGTRLTVTSASGTSSADLKGSKGDKGDDYILTDADKNDIAQIASELVDVPGGGGGLNLTLLWQNASPQSSFASQTIALAGNTASKILIQFASGEGGIARITYAYFNTDDADGLGEYEDENYYLYEIIGEGCVTAMPYSGGEMYRRTFRYFKTSLYFDGCEQISNGSVSTGRNDSLIPIRVYAIG